MRIEREQAVAYRIAAHYLDARVSTPPRTLPVLDLGIQDTPYGSARLALAARTDADLDDADLRLVWVTRGAPHVHRAADLPALAAALWPVSDADASARFVTTPIREARGLGISAFIRAARAMREVVTRRMPKGEVSAQVSALVPPEVTYWCKVCEAQHISGALFQQVGVFAGVQVEPEGSRTFLAPLPGDRASIPPMSPGTPGPESIIRAYLRLLGPATVGQVAGFLGTKPAEIRRVWPDDLVEVEMAGTTRWITADAVKSLESAVTPRSVRLLPPSDPYLQARDRETIVPDEERRKEIWRVLGSPGAVLVDGEIAGVWRARKKGQRLEVMVTTFEGIAAEARDALEEEAARVADARGLRSSEVTY